jgi:type I restriction enzyme S subunit
MDWESTTVGEVIEVLGGDVKTGPFGTELKAEEYTEKGSPVIAVSEIEGGRIKISDSTPRIPGKVVERLSEYKIEKGDILLGRKGAVERSALAGEKEDGWIVGSDCIRLRLPREVDPKFVAYKFQHPHHMEWMRRNATGSTMPSLNQDIVARIPLRLPPLPVQRRIADILGALDDKIELNRRMNETLEAMAQALYRHWFVDFGPFQGQEFTDTEKLGPIPKEWDVKPAYDLCDVLTGGTPKTKKDEYWGGDIKWVSAKDISDTGTFVMDTERKVTPKGVEESTTDVLPERTVVVVARGSVGKHCIIGEDMAMNQSCYGLRGREEIGQSWTYLMLNNLIRRLQQVAYGSVFDTITISTFKNTEIVAPPVEVISHFEEKVDPLFDLMHSNVKENETLAETRDYLLPKLISGEIEVEAAEDIAKESEVAA